MAALTPAQALQLALAQHEAGRLAEAEALYRRILAVQPQQADALHGLGAIALAAGHDKAALELISKAIALSPGSAIYHSNLGVAYRRLGRTAEAIAAFSRALALRPDLPDTHASLAAAFTDAGRFAEAIASGQRALALDPNCAEAHHNLGKTYAEMGRWEEAMAACRRAVALRPDLVEAHANLAFLLLRLGHYEEGWREHEWRWRSPAFLRERGRFSAPQWEGRPAPGQTILVHAEQGYGDAIQFLRYLPLVHSRAGAARTIFISPARLGRLLIQVGGWRAEILPRERWDAGALPPFDQHLPLLSAPLALGIAEPLPMSVPYLRADPELRAAWRERLGPPGFRVGVAWAGSSQHKDDRRRSLEFEKLRPLLRVPGVSFFSLQVEPCAELGVIDFSAHLTDFAETAALMAELDLIISVDTAAAHLAGALGRPVWTLLPFVSDWRWGLERDDTPWYPTMRLFRQRTAGDWDEVVQRVVAELSALRC